MKGEWVRRPQKSTAIIFLHGVLSSGETCWRNANGADWPSLVHREPGAVGVGIYVFTYRTSIFSGSYRLGDVVDALKEQMRVDGLFDCRRLIFVAHSMGGIVARKLLIERVTDFKNGNISVGLFLVASPSLGSSYANLLSPLARLLGHSQGDVLRFCQDNAWLMDLDKEFTNLKEARTLPLIGKELVEDTFIAFKGLIRRQIVEPFAGARYFGEAFKVPGSDHFSIAKPESAHAIQHRLLMRFIEEMPEAKDGTLPLEQELREKLTVRLAACNAAQVPFRTYHKLAALLDMSRNFTESCFEAGSVGISEQIRLWLRETIVAQEKNERGHAAHGQTLDDDETVANAERIAREEGAEELDERHLLLTILADRTTGTMEEITQSVGEQTVNEIESFARISQPGRLRMKSKVPAIQRRKDPL